MIKINEIPNHYEPRNKIIPKLEACPQGFVNPEMSDFESAFLCGLLKTYRPKKILEVGVAGGTTTVIIIQALEDIGEAYEIHSIDLSEKYYSDKTKPTGYMATFAKENNLFDSSHSTLLDRNQYPLKNNLLTPPQSTLIGNHEFHLGKYLPQVIDEIGGDIDFVILDTVHWMPGENLDFLAVLPYLKDGAIVAMHDTRIHFGGPTPLRYATAALFSSVVSREKFLNYKERKNDYTNIAAFRVSEETRTNIENVFLALMLTWYYIPNENEIKIYLDCYNKHYPAKLIEIFLEALKYNRIYQTKKK